VLILEFLYTLVFLIIELLNGILEILWVTKLRA
jgi:hypothetical protein